MNGELRLAEPLAALSVATDLGMGHAPEKAVRSCLVATSLARAAGLPESEVRDVYYTAMLQHVGCTAAAHETTRMAGDDLPVAARAERTDERQVREVMGLLSVTGRGTGRHRVGHVARVLTAGRQGNAAILRSVCEVGTRMAERLRLGEGVRAGLHDNIEGWDGKGGPYGLAGDDIAVPARFTAVAVQAVIFDRLGGVDAALEMVRRRAGGWFDPAIADTFARVGGDILSRLAEVDVWAEVLDAEPAPRRVVPDSQLDDVAAAFADMVDLKTPHTLGHSSEVAEVATSAARALGLGEAAVVNVRRAGLLHDLGRVAVSGGVWERPGALTSTQWEQVRLHAYHSERILARSATWAAIAPIAGMHHERHDGSGYHRGASGSSLPPEASVLAAADAFQAMTQDRPHRSAIPPDQAAALLQTEAAAGRLHPEATRAVVKAAGQRAAQRHGAWPAGLTDREVDVLRLVARGLSNRDVAANLFISRRTAEHHLQHAYAKI